MASRRIPLFPLIAATALALVAAVGVAMWLGADDESSANGDPSGSGSYQLTPAGELPASAADVTLAALDGGPDRKLGELLGSKPVV
ncbi:MAG TPA: hypothetical protein VIZ67_07285, partial [Acidimicrobiales bacterium]